MTTHRTILPALAAIVLTYSAHATQASEPNWPQFRGPGGLGIAPDNQTYPAKLDMSSNLLWKTEVPRGHSSPCIWGDDIFITASSGNSLETICMDRANGRVKWRKSVKAEKLERINGSNSHAAPTPVCNGKKVYVYFGSFGLIAYDLEGNEVWNKPLAVPTMQHGSAASPVLANNMVILNSDPPQGGYLLAMDPNTGETIWKQERRIDSPSWSTPVIWNHGNEQELVVFDGSQLTSYDFTDGRKRWWFDDLPITYFGVALTPVCTEDSLFVAATVGQSGDPVNPIELPDFKELLEMYDSNKDNHIVKEEIPEDMALIYRRGPDSMGVRSSFSELDTDKDGAMSETEWNKVVTDIKKTPPNQMDALVSIRSGGKGDISRSHVQWKVYEGIGQVPSPLFYQGRIYLVKHGGNVTCYNAKTGDKVYGDRVRPRAYYFSSPVAADNKIYFCSSNGTVIVVQAGDTFRVLAENKIGGRFYATPALLDGKIYLRTDKNMYAFTSAGENSVQTLPDIIAKEHVEQSKTLYEAAAEGKIELVKSFISDGADVNVRNDWGWTPMYVAAAVGNEDMIKLLITKGANAEAPNKQGETPMHIALKNGHKNIVRLLVENGADFRTPAKNGLTPLHIAAEQGDTDILTLLIDKGADVNANAGTWAGTPLHQAAGGGHIEAVKLLVANGANVNSKNSSNGTPLHWAARGGYANVVELLLTNGADFKAQNKGGRTPAGFANENGHAETVELLRKYANQSGDSRKVMSFYDYVVVGDIDQVRSLIIEGLDVNTKSQNGIMALHLASTNGHKDIAELLVQNGADINAGPQTPLILACQEGNGEIAELLIDKGADINTKSNYGQTPLHLAAQHGQKSVAELLVAKGADVNAKDRWSWTPLHYACGMNRKETAELLLAKGADINARAEGGKTPLGVAEDVGNTELVELLKKHGAKE